MSTVAMATSPADVRAVEAVKNRRARLAGALGVQVEALVEATALGGLPRAASDALVRWCEAELIPYAVAEEQAMYTAAREDPRSRLLVDAMPAEHCNLVALVEAIRHAASPVRAAANALALRSLFESHLVKENDQVLRLLAGTSEVSLAGLLDGAHELLSGQDQSEYAKAPTECGCGGECGCGHQHPSHLDARLAGPRPMTTSGISKS
jgi:Hemerythrin HHE cation binding domain